MTYHLVQKSKATINLSGLEKQKAAKKGKQQSTSVEWKKGQLSKLQRKKENTLLAKKIKMTNLPK